jgi:hypothetical protein
VTNPLFTLIPYFPCYLFFRLLDGFIKTSSALSVVVDKSVGNGVEALARAEQKIIYYEANLHTQAFVVAARHLCLQHCRLGFTGVDVDLLDMRKRRYVPAWLNWGKVDQSLVADDFAARGIAVITWRESDRNSCVFSLNWKRPYVPRPTSSSSAIICVHQPENAHEPPSL